MRMRSKLSLASGSAIFALLVSQPAIAQDVDDDEALRQDTVIVTATKRNATLEETAGSLNVLSGDEIGPGGIQNVADLSLEVPNLSVGDQFGVNRTFIRGVGFNSIDLGADGAVAFLQNGSVLARPAAQLAGFYDLAQVEVLRGPQGTLYGRGATGGVVNLVTARPTEDFTGFGRLTVGNYETFNAEGALSGPLSEGVSGRLAVKYESRDGFGENRFTGNPVDDRDAIALRGSLQFDVSDELEVLIVGDYFQEDDNNYAFHFFGPSVVPAASLPGPTLGGSTIFNITNDPETRDIFSNEDAINDRDGWGGQLITTWTPGDWSVVSTTSYREFNRFNRNDLDSTEVNAFGQNNYTEESESFSQDFTIGYEQDTWSLLGGATYFYEDLFGEVLVPTLNLAAILAPGVLPPNAFDNGNFQQLGSVETQAFGAFLEARTNLTPDLSVTAGVRYNYEERDGEGTFTFDAAGIFVPTDQKADWDAWTPKLLVEYQATDDALLYASITRGFKSGVINVGSVNPVIDPEFVWSYEAGFKTSSADQRATLNGAAFYYDYSDLQVGFVNAANIVETVNAASARIWGLELDGSFEATENLTLRGFATYLDAEFEDFCTGYYAAGDPTRRQFPACPTNPAISDLSGNRLPNAPEFTAAVFADYRVELGEKGYLDLSGELNYQDDVFFTEFNNRDAFQEANVNLNANVRYSPAAENWSLTLWGRNLTDEYVIANNITTAPLFGFARVGSLKPPLTYGLTLDVNF